MPVRPMAYDADASRPMAVRPMADPTTQSCSVPMMRGGPSAVARSIFGGKVFEYDASRPQGIGVQSTWGGFVQGPAMPTAPPSQCGVPMPPPAGWPAPIGAQVPEPINRVWPQPPPSPCGCGPVPAPRYGDVPPVSIWGGFVPGNVPPPSRCPGFVPAVPPQRVPGPPATRAALPPPVRRAAPPPARLGPPPRAAVPTFRAAARPQLVAPAPSPADQLRGYGGFGNADGLIGYGWL